ncbi:SUN domain-containing protein 1-like [Ooceraea biroi]|uniref:SUN domain-containing protein 1-like n=1 Tax=Ooceraea biroi TaxID=2015173 RepID=UPI000F08149A|nr:SUN domain-containing protein 1-like [Ooceraea biroi]
MSAQNTFCCVNAGNCPAIVTSCNRRPTWYTRLVKSFTFCVITSMLAMSVSHLCDKYSASTSFQMIQADLGNLRAHLGTLSLEVKNVMEMRDELKSKLKEVGSVIPKMSEAILNLRNEVSEGGAILSTRNTESYSIGAPTLNLFGIPLCQQQNTPRAVIQTGVLPGDCWAFKGSSGSVVIRLLGYVYVSGISLEHISSSISPTGETDTAPKDFSVWGLTDVEDKQPFAFGRFTYDNTGPPLQYFEVQERANKAYDIIELKVHSNSGNPEYTCIYRIRVHGTLNPLRK